MEKLLSIKELFKTTWGIYKKRAWTLAGIFLVHLVASIIFAIGSAIAFIGGMGFYAQSLTISHFLVSVLIFLVAILIITLATVWATLSAIVAIKEESMGAKQSLASGGSKLISGLWVYCLVCLAVLGGLLLLIVPGFIFAIWFSFAIFIFVADGTTGTAALKASKKLVSGYWWPIFGRIVLMMLISMLINLLFKGLAEGMINALVVTPFFLVYQYQMYLDLKRVKAAV